MASPLTALWPPWRFGGNIKSKNDADIETLSDGCVTAEWCFAGLVIAGIVGEFVIAAIHPPYDSLLGWWGPAYADLVVAVGIVCEVIAGVAAHTCQNELTRRSNDRLAQVEFDNGFLQESAALANERAAKLEKEAAEAHERTANVELLTAWRRISLEQRRKMVDSLESVTPLLRLFFEYQNGDQEAFSYAAEIANVFVAAGIVESIAHRPNLWMQGGLFGTSISVSPDLDASAILTPFEAVEIPLRVTPWDPLKLWPTRQDQPRPNVYIAVHPKPPPEFPTAENASD